jgi:hypothetical protein
MKQNIKEVAQAIISLQDHGGDCVCSICQKDRATIDQNIEIAEQLAVVLVKLKH